eukprot:gene11285-2692_t
MRRMNDAGAGGAARAASPARPARLRPTANPTRRAAPRALPIVEPPPVKK